jgi:hypothetical protein
LLWLKKRTCFLDIATRSTTTIKVHFGTFIVSGLCEEADLEAQMFNLAQMFIRNPNVQFSTEPAFLQNPC